MALAEPAEVLVIKDQYDRALQCLNRGLAADEAGRRPEALELYRRGRRHLVQGLEVPTQGERHRGPRWDAARQLQRTMSDTLRNIASRLAALESAELAAEAQGDAASADLPPGQLYPALGPDVRPPFSPLHHLYPTVAAAPSSSSPSSSSPSSSAALPLAPALPPPPADSLPAGVSGADVVTGPSLPVFPALALGVPGEQPPAYTPQPTEGHHSLAYSPAGRAPGPGETAGGGGGLSGEELLFLPRGVQMFFVTPSGEVSAPSYPGYLRVITFSSQSKGPPEGGPSAFLHVCDWLYPLTADTPVLLANSGIFMFPDTMAGSPGSYVGIVLSAELPEADREMFQDLLSQLTELRVQAPEEGAGSEVVNLSENVPIGPPGEGSEVSMATEGALGEEEKPPLPEWSEKMAQGILAGASWFSKGFVRGAEATGKAIHKGASRLRVHITPENTPSEVSPHLTRSLQVAKQATGGAVRVSQFLVNGVSTVAGCVGDKLAPHVKKHGSKLIPESMKKTKDGRSNLEGAMVVASSSIQGLSAVWTGLETGAKNVGKSIASETVTTVKYKYGDDAGTATDTAVQSAVNMGVTVYNVKHLAMKAILKETGKKTAKAVVSDDNTPDGEAAETKDNTPDREPAERGEGEERRTEEDEKKQ